MQNGELVSAFSTEQNTFYAGGKFHLLLELKVMYCPFQKRAGEWGNFRPAKPSGIVTRDRV